MLNLEEFLFDNNRQKRRNTMDWNAALEQLILRMTPEQCESAISLIAEKWPYILSRLPPEKESGKAP